MSSNLPNSHNESLALAPDSYVYVFIVNLRLLVYRHTIDAARGVLGALVESFCKECVRKSERQDVGECQAESVGGQQTRCHEGIRHRTLTRVVVHVDVTSSSIGEGIIDAAVFNAIS
jgi:hypothetical protein